MNPEERIRNCRLELNQIKKFEPDPYYTKYFLKNYILNVKQFFDEIFQEASRDFGFCIEDCNLEKFESEAKKRDDAKALKFVNWFKNEFFKQHKNTLPQFIKKLLEKKSNDFPKMKIMLRAKERYKDDLFQEIIPNLSNNKIKSKDELDIEIKRQTPVFLAIINEKRKKNNEPNVKEGQIIASVFTDIEDLENIEIAYVLEIYIPILEHMLNESRKKIKKLTQWEES